MCNNDVPDSIKIYHIVHIDKLASILKEGCLLCDSTIQQGAATGTSIGIGKIKRRRREELILSSHPGLYVGDCVPFYFCSRSVMLFILHIGNHPEIDYTGGQEPILHLMADFEKTICWANQNNLRYAFTSSNAGAFCFNDYTDKRDLNKINWNAVSALNWQGCSEGKQAEFLIERCFPWKLVEKVGVYSELQCQKVRSILAGSSYQPPVKIEPGWYYN